MWAHPHRFEITQIHEIAAQPATKRGCDFGVAQIQTGAAQSLASARATLAAATPRSPRHFDHLGLGPGFLLEESLGTDALLFPLFFAAGLWHFPLGPWRPLSPGLIFPGINHKKQISFFHHGTGSEVHALQKAGYPGAHLRLLESMGGAGKFQVVGDLLLQGLCRRHFWRGRLDILVSLAATGSHPDRQQDHRRSGPGFPTEYSRRVLAPSPPLSGRPIFGLSHTLYLLLTESGVKLHGCRRLDGRRGFW